jgi:V8-like Glu-specific endopeptidase
VAGALATAGTVATLAAGNSDKQAGAVAKASRVVANGNVSQAATMTPAQTYKYWTPQRMASAIEVPAPNVPEGPVPAATAASAGGSGTSPGFAPKKLIEGPTGGPPVSPVPAGAQSLTEPYHGFIPYTRWYYFAKYLTFPVSTVAKVFFTNNGGNYVCSGATIYTNIVNTAGHCVANTDGTHVFDSSALVCPSYNAGVNPAQGCWAATNFWTTTVWLNTGSFEYDMGMIITSTCGTVHCNSIAASTGYLGYAYGQGYDQDQTAFGYPQASPFDGNYIVVCNSQFGYQDSDGNNQGGPNSAAIGCDTTGGTSGGPWIIRFGSNNWLNGHNDWRHTAFPQEMNSPYYDSRWCSLVNAAGRPCT